MSKQAATCISADCRIPGSEADKRKLFCRREIAVCGGSPDPEGGGEFADRFAGGSEPAQLFLAIEAELVRFGGRQIPGAPRRIDARPLDVLSRARETKFCPCFRAADRNRTVPRHIPSGMSRELTPRAAISQSGELVPECDGKRRFGRYSLVRPYRDRTAFTVVERPNPMLHPVPPHSSPTCIPGRLDQEEEDTLARVAPDPRHRGSRSIPPKGAHR